jgi:hypothetical protein
MGEVPVYRGYPQIQVRNKNTHRPWGDPLLLEIALQGCLAHKKTSTPLGPP